MRTYLECLPCLARSAVEAAKRSTGEDPVQRQIMKDSLTLLADADLRNPPPYFARKILNAALTCSGKANLYDGEKQRSNHLAEQVAAELPNLPEYTGSFESRLRLAAAGNILDFGVFSDLDMKMALDVVRTVFTKQIDMAAVRKLQAKMESAKRILYLLDNCGEAIFDRIFMTPYKDKITVCVRSRQVLNDVTESDLADCGLSGWNCIPGDPYGAPGIILSEADDRFRKIFTSADLVIAKGQGNFETLNECTQPIAFLFLAKCPVVIRLLNAEPKSIQVRLMNF